jgi:hypothetical protein
MPYSYTLINVNVSAIVDGGLLSGFFVGSRNMGALHISHLLFTDDTLIFCRAKLDHLRYLFALFLCFEAIFGLKINLANSKLVPMDNVNIVDGLAS